MENYKSLTVAPIVFVCFSLRVDRYPPRVPSVVYIVHRCAHVTSVLSSLRTSVRHPIIAHRYASLLHGVIIASSLRHIVPGIYSPPQPMPQQR